MARSRYYGDVYVYARCSQEELIEMVRQTLAGTAKHRTVTGSGFEVDVLAHDEYDESRAVGGAGNFLYFPFRLEVEETEVGDAVARSALLLNGLRAAGYAFVMVADFEDDLPNKGRSPNYVG